MSKQNFDSSEFVVSAPDLQIGLSPEIEQGTRPREFLNRYHASYDIRCAFCAGHTLHRRGFTVQLDDGRIALCGIDCAKIFFGEEVASRFEWDLHKQIEQQNQRRILARTVDGSAPTLEIIEGDWIAVERAYANAVNGILAWVDLGDLKRDITGDALILKKTKTQWVDAAGRDGHMVRKKQTYDLIGARVQGASCLLSNSRPMALAKGGLASLVSRAKRPDDIKGDVVAELMSKRRMIIEMMEEGVAFAKSAHTFFQEKNLAEFQKWYRSLYSGEPPIIQVSSKQCLTISSPKFGGLPVVTSLPSILPDPKPLFAMLSSSSMAKITG